jgi:tetratricopeptide (TPR) repeat protein
LFGIWDLRFGVSRKLRNLKRLALALLFVLGTAATGAAATQVYARVDAATAIYPGEDFTYSVVVEGGGQPSKIDISPLAAFSPRRAGSGTSMQTVNGLMTVSYSENFALTAGQPGVMHLPEVTVVVDGRTYTTNPVDVTVSRPGTTDRMSVECLLSDKECYVGQPLVMTVRWIVTARVQDGAFEVPVFRSDDFYLEDLAEAPGAGALEQTIHGVPVRATEQRQLIRGVEGAVISFRKVLIPKRAGHLRLDPVSISANMAVGRERTGDFFDPYRIRFQRVSAQSDPVELEVRPLPEQGRPPQFYGLVGRYTIAASAAPTKVNVGDPITLTIRIGGNPFLKPVQWPGLEQVPELAANFKIPNDKASPVLEGGAKVFTQTLRANSEAVTRIPPLSLAYFDPEQGDYVVAQTEPIPLAVAPTRVLTNVDVEGTTLSAPANREVEAIRKGLSANYYGPEVLVNQHLSVLALLMRPAYAVLWSVPLLGLVISAAVQLARRTSPESLARKRRRRAAAVARAQLQKVPGAELGQRHELLLAALQGYIGDRFDRVAASLTADECHQVLVEATGDTAAAARCKQLIEACEAARYAPLQAQVGPDQVREAAELIQSVEKTRPAADRARKSHLSYRPSVLLLGLCLLLGPTAHAAGALPREQLPTLLQEANAAFQQANAAGTPETARPLYDRAILLYEKLIDQGGIQNAKLYYNLANAYLLRDDLGRAILNYRRALKLDRSDLNIQKNLAFARSRRTDRVETSTEKQVLGTLFFWHYDFSLRTKVLLACLCFAAVCTALTAWTWLSDTRRPPGLLWAAAFAGVLLAALLASLAVEARHRAVVRPGVVTAAQVVARQGDGPNYPPSFKEPLHAGMEFELLEQRPGWLHIVLSDSTDAWIPADTAGLV